jgi:CRP/FNR family transcriptional regulator
MSHNGRIGPTHKEQRKGHFLAEKDKFCAYCAVRSVSFCGMVPNEDMANLSGRARPLTLDRRKTLFHQGDETQSVFIVTSGTLQLYQLLADGRRQVIGFSIPGDLLGFPFADHNDYGADALDSVYLCQFPRQDFVQFVSEHSHLMRAVLMVTYDELTRARAQTALVSQKNAERKMAQFLLSFRGRQDRPDGETAILPVRIPQADIADFLGLTIETVNRMLARFMREATITITEGGIELIDLPRLHALSEG